MQVEVASQAKRGQIIAFRMGETAMVAACLLHSRNIGVFPERDTVWAIMDYGVGAFTKPVLAQMTCSPASVQLDDTVDHALTLMGQHHICHPPVLHGGALAGVISMRDMLPFAAPV